MMNMALSPAAFGLLRALAIKAEIPRDRILLRAWRSVDWQSLTFVGERHHISLRICGPDSAAAVGRLTSGLEEAEFDIPGQIVADIAVVGGPDRASDGSTTLNLEALTVAE